MTNDQYLHQNRAWNWVWPDSKNRWPGPADKPKGPSQGYRGPSKRTLNKRAAKVARGRR